MSISSQDQFEQEYADYTKQPIDTVRAARLSNGSYKEPKIAAAWYWWKRSREVA